MTKSINRIINTDTQEITDIEFSAEEIAVYIAEDTAARNLAESKLAAKQAVLDKLGLTADELAAALA
jgi:hypothetical protein